jgi:hypothetical protein
MFLTLISKTDQPGVIMFKCGDGIGQKNAETTSCSSNDN